MTTSPMTTSPGSLFGGAPARRGRWGPVALGAVALGVAAAVVLLLAVTSGDPGARLDPSSRGEQGSAALAGALSRHRIAVVRVEGTAALAATAVDEHTTILVAAPLLSGPEVTVLDDAAARAGRLVLVAPSPGLLDELDLPVRRLGGPVAQRLRAACDGVPGIAPTDRLAPRAFVYAAEAGTPATACYPPPAPSDGGRDAAPPAAGRSQGAYLDLPANGDRPDVTILGSADALTNVGVTSLEQAGFATAALTRSPRLVWYLTPALAGQAEAVPPGSTSRDGAGGGSGGGAESPVPTAFGPSVVLLLIAGATLTLWRGRRLGRLVVEPLPVVIHALETTRARAGLYARSGDAAGALALLTEAALTDLRRCLRLPPDADVGDVARTLAPRVGQDPASLAALLSRTSIAPADLPAHAAALRRLRRKARQP